MPDYYGPQPLTYDTITTNDGRTIKVPRPSPGVFIKSYQEGEGKEVSELAEWEKELLGYSVPQRFMAGTTGPRPRPGGRVPRGADPCGNTSCDLCYGYEENPDCEGCKARDRQIKDLKSRVAELSECRSCKTEIEKTTSARAEADAAKQELEAMREERNRYDKEADDLADELERAIDQRDKLIEMLMWSEEQLLKAWEQVEALKGA